MKNPREKVGYKNPPKNTQFQPGKSGNPAGRPKGAKNLRTDLAEEMAKQVTVVENGQQLRVTKQRAAILALIAKVIKGDTSAAKALFTLSMGCEQIESTERIAVVMTGDDDEVMQAFKDKVRNDIVTEDMDDDEDREAS